MKTLGNYAKAINAARRTRHMSLWLATRSVVQAKFGHGIGPRLHSLFSLADVSPDKWGEYKFDRELRGLLRELNPDSERRVVNDKEAFFEHCMKYGIPTIPILWCDLRGNRHEWQVAVCNSEYDKLFFKLVNGAWGQDSFMVERNDNRWRFCGQVGSIDELYDFCEMRCAGRRGWLIQPVLSTNRAMHDITSPKALSTIRIVTCLDQQRSCILYAVLKIVVGDNVTDNFLHGSTGNMVVPVDLDTGALGWARGSAERDWPSIVSLERHPQTNALIRGFQIPFWDDAKKVTLDAHRTLPQLKTLGWDIAISDDGPVVVEANANYDGDLLQVALGRGLKSELFRSLRPFA